MRKSGMGTTSVRRTGRKHGCVLTCSGRDRTVKEYDIFKMYVDEMSAIRACDAAENASLALRAARGDDAAKSRLIEGNLRYVLELARDYVGNGVPASDLVQEANIALLMAVEEYEPDDGDGDTALPEPAGASESAEPEPSVKLAGAFERFLAEYVKTALRDAVKEHKAQNRIGKKVLDRVNLLLDVSKRMAEELGREATVPELAQELRMTEDEVKDTMKVALDALEVLGE